MSSRRNRELTRTTVISILCPVNFISQYKYRQDKSVVVSNLFVLQVHGGERKTNVNKVDICDVRKKCLCLLKGVIRVYLFT